MAQRQPHMECRALATLGFEIELATMALDDHVERDTQALAGAASHFLRREERIEDPRADLLGNAAARVGDGDDDMVAIDARRDVDAAALAGLRGLVRDGVR